MPSLLEQYNRRGAAAAAPAPGSAGGGWRPRAIGDAYSRRVALLKRVLPAFGLGLLLLVGAWPRLEPSLYNVRPGLPTIHRRDARELQMVHPRYAGVDRLNRPYVLTAAAGRKMSGRDDLVSFDEPRGRLLVRPGENVLLTAAAGIYQTQSRLMDLFGNVTLTRQDGTRFVTEAAHIDFSSETASGHDPVAGRGPAGSITAQGFRILNRGDTVVFTGLSHLLIEKTSALQPAPPAPRLPAPIEEAATRIAAEASASAAQRAGAASSRQSRDPGTLTPGGSIKTDAAGSERRRHGG